MRLSTAIRIGSMTTKQIKARPTDGHNGRCAIGAALDAVSMAFTLENWGYLACKVFGIYEDRLSMIWWMNDIYNYTREEIADVVEALENLEARNWEKKSIIQKENALCH